MIHCFKKGFKNTESDIKDAEEQICVQKCVQWPEHRAKIRDYAYKQLRATAIVSITHASVFIPSSLLWLHTMQVLHMLQQVKLAPFA